MKMFWAGTILLMLLMPVVAIGGEKAKSIDELAKMYDVSSCKTCHAEIYNQWEKSYHAKSLVGSPRTMATLAGTIRDGLLKEYTKLGLKGVKDIKVEHLMICAKCHLPQLTNATDAVAQEIAQAAIDGADGDEAARKKLEKLGINCLICHNQKAIIHKWTDGEVDPKAVYGKKEGAHADAKYNNLRKSPIIQESILCGQCHGLGPNFEMAEPVQCATLYGSYLHAYIPSGGSETCQECHMKKDGQGHFMPAYRDDRVAKKAVDVQIETQGYKFLPKAGDLVPMAVVNVKLTSKAGHRIPDG